MNFVKNNFSKRRESNNPRRSNQFNRGRGQQPVSTLDPRLFVKKAVPLTEARYESNRSINDLPVDARIKTNLLAKGYLKPTEIQDKTIEAILNKSNLLGIAQTGTGKTGAFLIPVVHNLIGSKAAFQVLVVVPTRELAVQVEEEDARQLCGL